METKVCTKCKVDKPITEYCKQATGKMGVQPACKMCMNVAYNISRKKKQNHYQQVAKDRQKGYLEQYHAWKDQQKCYVCEEDDAACLDLHHLDPSQKEGSVADLVWARSWSRLQEEIKKCVVLCSNCHRKVHAGRISLRLGKSG